MPPSSKINKINNITNNNASNNTSNNNSNKKQANEFNIFNQMRDQGVTRPPLYKKSSAKGTDKQASKDTTKDNNMSKSNRKIDNNSSKIVCFE